MHKRMDTLTGGREEMAEMARRIQATHLMLEEYALCVREGVPEAALFGQCALLKVQATRSLEFCAREASQVLGGASYLREGAGRKVERIYREVRVMAIGGGSEE